MAVYTRVLLSGSAGGLPIPVAATVTPGTLIHTAVGGASSIDEVYLWASNVSGAAATLTIEWGGVTDPASHLVKAYSIPANSAPMPISVGQPMNGGLVIRAFASVANVINVTGMVTRIV